MNKIKAILILVLIFISTIIFAVPNLRVYTDTGPDFQVGETFEVKVDLSDNEGAYGVFLDLYYNNTVFELMDVNGGDLLPAIPDQSEFLTARAPYNEGGRIIISNSLVGNRELFTNNGSVVSLVFKTLRGADNETIGLNVNSGIYVNMMKKVEQVNIINLTGLRVIGPYTNYFIQIISPYNNYRSNTDLLDFHVLATIENPNYNDDFTVGLKRVVSYHEGSSICPNTSEFILPLESGQAYFSGTMPGMIELNPGINYVVATLYVNNVPKAATVKRVYYDPTDRGISIESPINNYITGKSIITVNGKSTFKDVFINNVKEGIDVKMIDNDSYEFVKVGMKLKEGFNKIVATTINPQASEIIYKDTVVVYYQRDESIFDFINPLENEVFKTGKINIKGVIDTNDKDLVKVSMRIYFKPFGIGDDFSYAFLNTDEGEEIKLRELENNENYLLSHYIFESEFDLDKIKGLGSGILTIYALKDDKQGNNKQIEISRSVVINTEDLKIDLRQPNLFSEQIIASKTELSKYYYPAEYNPDDNNIDISDTARIFLKKKSEPMVYDDAGLVNKNIIGYVITANGNEYAVINNSNTIELYKKGVSEKDFNLTTKKSVNNAYANCAIEFGNNNILMGISDYETSRGFLSGLLLYNNGILRNAKFPFEINHVQYIKKQGTDYYLYASNYTYLYKFNEADVVVSQRDLKTFEIRKVEKYYLPNNLFINGFEVMNNGRTIILATDIGIMIYRFNPNANSYDKIKVIKDKKEILKLASAELENSYNIYFFAYKDINQSTSVEEIRFSTITEKDGTDYIVKDTSLDNYKELYQIKHIKNNEFIIYGRDDDQLNNNPVILRKAEVFYGIESISGSLLADDIVIDGKININYLDEKNYLLFGKGIKVISEEYVENDGVVELIITDNHIDGITGFKFDAPACYEDLFKVEYALTSDNDFAYQEFKSAGMPLGDKALSRYEYNEKEGYKYLRLRITLQSGEGGLSAPFIERLVVNKKEIIKTTAHTLELKGFITDKTVEEGGFTVDSAIVELAENGSFYHVVNVDHEELNDITDVNLYAQNKSGDTDQINFKIIYVSSEPALDDIKLIHKNNNEETNVTTYPIDMEGELDKIQTLSEKIDLTGSFSGLYGVQVTAELYKLNDEFKISKHIWSYNAELIDDGNSQSSNEAGAIRSGTFNIEDISLVPGTQRIILRCMNPYGTKEERIFDVEFNVAEEKIEIINYELSQDKKISEKFDVTKQDDGKYTRSFELIGRVITSKPVDYINLRSDNKYISFSKGDEKDVSYIKIPLSEISKTFSVYVNLKMVDDNELLDEYFKIWPDSLQLANIGFNLGVEFNKVFSNIVPDFSVTQFDESTGEISLKFKFNEPVPEKMMMRLRLNHEDLVNGNAYLPFTRAAGSQYFSYEAGVYSFTAKLNAKNGINIIDWWFYQDKEAFSTFGVNDKLLSASGNTNYLSYEYDTGEEYKELNIVFPDNTIFYDDVTLKNNPLQITYDKRGTIYLKINDNAVNTADYLDGDTAVIDLTGIYDYLNQGINKIEIHYVYDAKNVDIIKKSEFKFDDKNPLVRITSRGAVDNFVNPYIRSITAEIKEDNLDKVNLIYDDSVVNVKPQIIITDEGIYLYSWENLESYNILPSKTKELYVEALDITGKSGISDRINSSLSLYYDIRLSNELAGTKVLNFEDITIGGTDDGNFNFSEYWNEADKSFDYHLKYEAVKLTDNQGNQLRDKILLNKEDVFNSTREYLMFVFENSENIDEMDLAYRMESVITKKAVVNPIDMLVHKGYTDKNYINSFNLGANALINGTQYYSIVEGYRVPETVYENYVGFAKCIDVYDDYVYVLDMLNQDKKEGYDYKAVIEYKLLTKKDLKTTEDIPGIPEITRVFDSKSIQDATNFKIYDSYIYIICGVEGILVFNLAPGGPNQRPVKPQEYLITPKDNNDNNSVIHDIYKKDNYLFTAAGTEGVKVYNIVDVAQPVEVYKEESPLYDIVAVVVDDDNIYAITSDKKLVKYEYNITDEMDNNSITFVDSLDINAADLNEPKLWFDTDEGSKLVVLAKSNTNIQIFDLSDFTFEGEGLACNNAPIDSNAGKLYPCEDSIKVVKESVGDLPESTTGSYGLVINRSIVYSASGDEGLRIIVADDSKVDDLVDSDDPTDNVPDNWNNNGTKEPVYYETVNAVINTENVTLTGVVELPLNVNVTGSAVHKSSIIKNLESDVMVNPATNVKLRLKLNINNAKVSLMKVIFKLREYGKAVKPYMVADIISSIDYTYNNIVKLPNNQWTEVEINLGDLGLENTDWLESVTFENDLIWMPYQASSSVNLTDMCYVDYVTCPEFMSFGMPLSHAAYKIDENPGDSKSNDEEMDIFDPMNMTITETGRVIAYFSNETSGIEEKFNEIKNEGGHETDLIGVEYSTNYFSNEDRKTSYFTQCADKQIDVSLNGENLLGVLNSSNNTKFDNAYKVFFTDRHSAETFIMGEINEELALLNPPANYDVYLTDTLMIEPPTDGDRIDEKTSKEVSVPRSKNGAISFWLRLEEEIPWFRNYLKGNEYYRDYNSQTGRSIVSWGADNYQDANYRFVVYPRMISFIQYKTGSGLDKTDTDIEAGNYIASTLDYSYNTDNDYGKWVLVTLTWDETGGLVFYIDDQRINEDPKYMNNFNFDKFLNPKIIFGDVGQNVDSLYYSIACPKVFNRTLTYNDVKAIYTAKNRMQGVDSAQKETLRIRFNNTLDIEKSVVCEDEIATETAIYEDTINGKGFVVTDGIKNYISNDFNNDRLMLSDMLDYANLIKDNAEASYDEINQTISLTRLTIDRIGIYHMTDGGGSGLSIPGDDSYTFFGRILSTNLSENDVCVIKINGIEQRFSLEAGDFKYTYTGVSGNLKSIDIYFEFENNIVFDAASLGFNRGRYKANSYEGYAETNLRMKHKFNHKESVVVYYKPLFVSAWELNGEEIVILDSQIYKIGIKNNKYYAVLKAKDGDVLLSSDADITGDLHQLALIYDFSSLIVKFYIDGKLEDQKVNQTFAMSDHVGVFPEVYNITIGGMMDDSIKAQGIIDEFVIYHDVVSEKILQDEYLAYSKIISINDGPVFNSSGITFNLQNNIDKNITVRYSFDNGDSNEVTINANSTNSEITQSFSIGTHTLTMKIDTGVILKTETYRFVVNYAPSLRLVDYKSIIIKGDNQLNFKLERDIDNSFAKLNQFIKVELYLNSTSTGLDGMTQPSQTITEDIKHANYGKYYIDNDESVLMDEIRFSKSYSPQNGSDKIYYRIKAYYVNNSINAFVMNGEIKILDIENPEIENDSQTNRPMRITSAIINYDPANDNTNGLKCNYNIEKMDNTGYQSIEKGALQFNSEGKLILNVYKYAENGSYRISLQPVDAKGNKGILKSVDYSINDYTNTDSEEKLTGEVWIDEFELILTDKEKKQAKYILTGGVKNLETGDSYDVTVTLESDVAETITLLQENINSDNFEYVVSANDLVVGGNYKITASVIYDEDEAVESDEFRYYGMSVNVKITHGPLGFISYNNVYFNWEGTLDGEYDSRIRYRYSIDNGPWSGDPLNDHVEFYNLEDGYHYFKVQAYIEDGMSRVYSGVKTNNFTIDTKKPVIDESKIKIEEVNSPDGIISHLKLMAEKGAVTDLTLAVVNVNDTQVEIKEGGFTVDEIPLLYDGVNIIKIEAVDLLGNATVLDKSYEFNVLDITYPVDVVNKEKPEDNELVKYSPLTVYGKITDAININDGLKIYLDDPYGRREAVLNFDRTFFVENVKINPGTEFKTIKTILSFVIDFGNGKQIIKEYPVFAKNTIKPIELELSVYAVSGGADTTEVQLKAHTDVENVSCWSFDYDGNGVYEDDYFTSSREVSVLYKYSTVGMIHPRVRIITNDNHIFSGENTLIIHDKIIKADIKDIEGAKSIDIIEVDDPNSTQVDGYEFVYILQTMGNSHIIKRYRIEANSYELLDNNSIYVNLTELNINYPRAIKIDENANIYVSSLYGSGSKLYRLVKTNGGYMIDSSFNVTLDKEIISSFDLHKDFIYMSLEKDNEILKYSKAGKLVDRKTPVMDNIIDDIGAGTGLEIAGGKLWIGDCMKQRVVSVSCDSLSVRDFFGEPGNGDGQFIYPKLVRIMDNYIYVLDQSEMSIQVFERTIDDFRIICRMDYNEDYLPEGFLNYITDFAVFTKIENNCRYHYLALVNNHNQQVALLRIPKWQPNSVKVKSNLIVYVKNNEIFTSKPDGADTKKIFSSGSLPGVDGNVDYPSIAPDGTTITFVSKIKRYEYMPDDGGFVFRKYDKLYMIDVDGSNCELISHPLINGKEIDRPQFSYNGSKIIFSAKGEGEYWAIYEYDRNEKSVNKLFDAKNDCMRPTYSPDDRYIAYVTKYYNHNEIVIYDRENPDLLITLTHNDYSDDYPVWAPVYEGEVINEDIKSKIAFISKPDFKEKIFYTYIAQATSGDFRIVKKDGSDIGNDPDSARNEFENINYDQLGTISYPCYTADGKNVIFESYKDSIIRLMQYNMEDKLVTQTGVPVGSRRPSGMKNRIVNFMAETVDGNNLNLTWDRYAEEELIYTVTYKSSKSDAEWVEKSFKSQDHALIEDLEMGQTYYVRVYVKDLLRGGEITTSVLKKVVVFPVVAKPVIEIDKDNPYLVRLKAWKPETDKPWEYNWKFRWFVDNYKLEDTFSDVVEYEFGIAGKKRIVLEAYLDGDESKISRSDDIYVDIAGDLTPVIEYELIEENNQLSISLDAGKSSGTKIDKSGSSYLWKLSGSNVNGNLPPEEFSGEKVIRNISNYSGNIYITLTVTSLPVMGQVEVIREQKSMIKMVSLGLNEIKPVIVENASSDDPTLYTFDGSSSIGNIDWTTSIWEVFGPDSLYFSAQGKTAFSYRFPERSEDTNYTVVLNARNKATNDTTTVTKMITVGKVPIIPRIDYKVITTNENGEIVTAKLLLSAANSTGNDIDWNTVTWSVPLAEGYGSSSKQIGPTAVYNLYNVTKKMSLDVHLTMQRRSTSEIIEADEVVEIRNNEVPAIVPVIEIEKDENENLYQNSNGDVYIFNALNSKGANIDWSNVTWNIDDQYVRQGPVARVDFADSGEDLQNIIVTLTLRSTAGGEPVVKTMSYNLRSKEIKIVVNQKLTEALKDGDTVNIVNLSVRDSIGRNIDWERTRWFIYQGPEDIVEKYGAEIVHSFPFAGDVEYYPVNVQMYYKGSTKPFVKNINIRVDADKLKAIIKEEFGENTEDTYRRTFSATDSLGSNIDWQSCKWTFGDSSEYQYGPVVSHLYRADSKDASYLVTLTITRKAKNGETEISTDTYTVNIGKDEMNAKIKVVREGNYVVFSAEESTGRGLLLDRSMWLFEGADNENYGESESEGDSSTSQYTFNTNLGISTSIGTQFGYNGPGGANGVYFGTSINLGFQWGMGWTNTGSQTISSQWSQSSGESSNNIYSGASCRKMIDGWTRKRVTLVIYRMLPDGTIEAQSKSFVYIAGQSEVQVIE